MKMLLIRQIFNDVIDNGIFLKFWSLKICSLKKGPTPQEL